MFTFIGILIILAGIAMLIIRPMLNEERVVVAESSYGKEYKEPSHPALLWFNKTKSIGFILIGLLFAMSSGLFMYAERGNQYLLVYPNGTVDAVMTPGIKMKYFARIDPWQKFIDVKAVEEGQDAELDEIEGLMTPVGIRFIDQVTAEGVVSIRFQLPNDKESFIKMAIEFRSMENLVYNTLIPTVSEQLKQTGYMYAAQDYISGSAQAFRQTFEETLKGGTYVVEKTELKDTVYSEIQIEGQRMIKEVQTSYQVDKVLENGIPKRIPHEITKNNIIVSQVIVDQINLEPTFKQRLEAQRDESAKRQLEQQKIETAKSTQQRIIAEGERDKAAERVEQEKKQVKTLIAIETKLKEEETNRKLATIQLETEKLTAAALKVKKDAEAYANRKLVQAGLTPQERANIDKEIAIGMAKALAGPNGLTLPSTYFSGGGNGKGQGNANDMLAQIMTMMMANQMQNQNKPSGK
jgi:hypothetical protein